MKYILHIVFMVLVIFSTPCSPNTHVENSNLKAKLNQTNSILHKYINQDTTLNKELLTQEFKEDYYITQLQLNQKQILTYVTILFSILGIIGAGAFAFYLHQFKTDQRNSNETYRNEQKQLYDKQIKLQNKLGLNFANTVITTAEVVKETNQFNYVFQTLMGLANYKHYGYALNNHESINQIILGQLRILNLEISSVITSNQQTRNLIWTYLSELTSIRNQEITNEVNILRSKINDQ